MIQFLSNITQPLQFGCMSGIFIMDSLSLSCFLDCCLWMLISILFCGIPTSVGASMRNLLGLFHFFLHVEFASSGIATRQSTL